MNIMLDSYIMYKNIYPDEEQDNNNINEIEINKMINEITLDKNEFNNLYWQVELLHQAIDFSKLRQYSYLRLKNSDKEEYHDLIMNLDDEKDGIYKKVIISPDQLSTSIQLYKSLDNEYLIFESIEFWYEEETYFSKILLKVNHTKNQEIRPLYKKEWLYDNTKKMFKELLNIDYRTYGEISLKKETEQYDKELYKKQLLKK